MEESTEALVGAAAGGDREAFGALVELTWARMVRLARAVVGDAEAEDVVQEAMLVAWRKLARLREAERFSAWLGRIVLRRAMRRARRTRVTVALDDVAQPSHTPNPLARVAVWQVLARLAPRQRAVLHLTAVEGMTDREIGDMLGIAPSSVRVHRRRARMKAAELLGGSRR